MTKEQLVDALGQWSKNPKQLENKSDTCQLFEQEGSLIDYTYCVLNGQHRVFGVTVEQIDAHIQSCDYCQTYLVDLDQASKNMVQHMPRLRHWIYCLIRGEGV